MPNSYRFRRCFNISFDGYKMLSPVYSDTTQVESWLQTANCVTYLYKPNKEDTDVCQLTCKAGVRAKPRY